MSRRVQVGSTNPQWTNLETSLKTIHQAKGDKKAKVLHFSGPGILYTDQHLHQEFQELWPFAAKPLNTANPTGDRKTHATQSSMARHPKIIYGKWHMGKKKNLCWDPAMGCLEGVHQTNSIRASKIRVQA
jgi:hypothetical protein